MSYRYYLANHQNWSKLISNLDRWTETGLVPLSILSATSPDDPEREFIKSRKFNEWCEEYIKTNKEKLPQHITQFYVQEVFNKIADYKFVTFPLKQDRKLHDICNIFARVNSKGMKLSTFDLMNAFLYSKGVYLRKDLWDNLDNEPLKNIDSSMNEHLLRAMSLVKQNYCSSKYLFNLIPGEETTRKDEFGKKYEEILVKNGVEFVSLWKKACFFAEKAREKIMNTGEFEFGAIRHDYIPNTTIVPPLAAILWQYSEKGDLQDRDFNINLKKWYWSAVLSEDYSGSSDSVMAKDFRDWMLWIEENTQIERINRITPEFISELNLQDVKKGSARYSAILCILSLNGADDFYKYRGVGSGDYIFGKIQDHHIFPSKVQGLPSEKSTEFKSSKDSIVNRTLLLDETNTKINNRKPSEYLAEIEAKLGADKIKPIMESHFINEKALVCMWNDDFDGFIREREREIKAQLIRVLGIENIS